MLNLDKWPPAYTLRRSRRARHISLQINPREGLELIVPYRADINEALTFLNSKRSWIEKHADVLEKNTDCDANPFDLPTEIVLKALEKSWALRYHFFPKSKLITLCSINDRLIFTGNIADFKSCSPLLKRWIKKQARIHFSNWLTEINNETGLSFNKLSVRSQKTLWGSCSRERNISLNCKLLFLPFELLRYVLIHELCHTVHFGHTKRFWQLVRRHEPQYQQYEQGLKTADQFIPRWLTAS